MGRPLLLLRLEGPLQSWGVRARWEIRDTQPEPTKSGIVGLLGCSLGYPRQDSRMVDELDKGLRMGVRVENPGRILEDYHTITDYLPTANSGFKHSGIRVGKDLQRIVDNPEFLQGRRPLHRGAPLQRGLNFNLLLAACPPSVESSAPMIAVPLVLPSRRCSGLRPSCKAFQAW